ncbi:adaptin ear-binding coat-associated protein 1 NECAP-1 [Pholiota conissans]|uniref:Adaptin ear-binding coat-associated protein 1 NECAP-1 n=1 Tax=Pholiota conissans TaxID=109636 RepID=A0A9P6CXC9_9AGAR|nr:adaptin ear-binding coat-associated protein 1 NECAP-1 [Pholiota conissans]
MELDEEIDSILYIAREVSVYKIPPLNANEGYRANDWGDLASPLWKGRLRIIENSKGAALQLEDAQTGELFARAEYDITRPSVEAVLDSSRYFVVRVEDAGKKAYIGLGFAERSDSFDFNVALQDYTKRRRATLNPPVDVDEVSPHAPAGPKKDYTLKEGQTFSINIPGRAKTTGGTDLLGSSTSTSASTSSTSGGIPLLPPPPSANKRR